MKDLNRVLSEVGISKVKLAKYLGVSRQMLYNYLAENSIEKWPKEKSTKLFALLGIKSAKDLKNIVIDGAYIVDVEKKIEESIEESQNKSFSLDMKGLSKKEQELFQDIFATLKQRLMNDKNKENPYLLKYLNNYLKSMDNTPELKYVLAYFSKSLGFVDPLEFAFNENQQYIFESIMYSGMSLYTNKGASRSKIAETHQRFVKEIEQKKEERLSRTQELNATKLQALRELGYTKITTDNAKEVLDKIVEIQSRKV